MADSTETSELRKDLDQLRKDFSTLSEDVKQQSNNQFQAGIGKACDSFQGIGNEIKKRPCTTVLATLGAGLLLGWIFRR